MFAEELAVFPSRYAGHLTLSLAAILTGLLVSIPLGIRAAGSPKLAGPALGAASLVQTIPGIALLALMVPVLGGGSVSGQPMWPWRSILCCRSCATR